MMPVHRFWQFVAERHDMFIRRFGQQLPPPWTNDPYLARGHFTNVYRELDRGTRYLITKILPWATEHPADTFFSVVVYRFFNLISTYEFLTSRGWSVAHKGQVLERLPLMSVKYWHRGGVRSGGITYALVKRQKAGHRVFTGAYMINSTGARPGIGGKVEVVMKRLDHVWKHLGDIRGAVLAAASMEAAHKELCRIPGVAAFNAYELVVDMCYNQAILPFSENDWVNPGPGAIKGLQEIYGQRLTRWDAQEAIKALCSLQRTDQQNAGVELHGPRLTLRNVEHSLCEYSKYCRMQRGERPKRTYKPGPYSDDYVLWATVPREYFGE